MFYKKRFFLFLSYCFSLVTCFAQGTWVQKANLPGPARLTAVAFTIGNKGYLGLGGNGNYLDDFWEYNPSTNSWIQKTNFPGGGRHFAVGFSIGNFGYVGTGLDFGGVSYQDFWRYDPSNNSWTQIADFGGIARSAACSFSIGNKGYVGTGLDYNNKYLNDFWEYDPNSNSWSQISNFIGSKRADIDRATFVIGNKAYVGTGSNGSACFKDFYEYDPATDIWTKKTDYPGAPVGGATGFSICNKGYLGLGTNFAGNNYADFWSYSPASNSWSVISTFPLPGRVDQPAFVINEKAYIGTGQGAIFYNDLWEFTPDNIQPIVPTLSNNTTICLGSNVSLSATGGSYYNWSMGSSASTIVVSPSTSTTYFVTISNDCDSKTLSTTITVIDHAAASFSYEYEPCKDACVNFKNQSTNVLTCNWDFGDGQNSSLYTVPCHSYNSNGNYNVSLVINNSTNCADTLSMIIPYEFHDTLASVYIPNAFSPNEDGENDVLNFQIKDSYCIKEFEITIYNRWGEKVFETASLSETWDGIYNGQKLDSQILSYYSKIITATDRQIIRKGNITLVR